jgi:ATP-dependent Clp protease protease subunit
MAPGSMLMIHKAWTFAIGNADELHSLAAVMDKIDGTIAETYAPPATKRGVEPADFVALMAAETWYTPDEAIAAGLADEQAAEKVKAKVDWDLSAYEHAPAPPKRPSRPTLTVEHATAAAMALKIAAAAPPPKSPTTNEIEEPRRPNLRADMLLRPAA